MECVKLDTEVADAKYDISSILSESVVPPVFESFEFAAAGRILSYMSSEFGRNGARVFEGLLSSSIASFR